MILRGEIGIMFIGALGMGSFEGWMESSEELDMVDVG